MVTIQQREAFTAERLPGNVYSPDEASIFNGASLDASRIYSANKTNDHVIFAQENKQYRMDSNIEDWKPLILKHFKGFFVRNIRKKRVTIQKIHGDIFE